MGLFGFFKKIVDSTAEDTTKRILKKAKERGFPPDLQKKMDRIEKEGEETRKYLGQHLKFLNGESYEGNDPQIIEWRKKWKEEERLKKEKKKKNKIKKDTYRKSFHDKYGEVIGDVVYKKTGTKNGVSGIRKEKYKYTKTDINAITEKYGEERANDIINNEISTDYSLEELYIMFGEDKDKATNISSGKKVVKYYFEASKNRLGNMAYDTMITFTDGKITGWSDLRVKSKRNT